MFPDNVHLISPTLKDEGKALNTLLSSVKLESIFAILDAQLNYDGFLESIVLSSKKKDLLKLYHINKNTGM